MSQEKKKNIIIYYYSTSITKHGTYSTAKEKKNNLSQRQLFFYGIQIVLLIMNLIFLIRLEGNQAISIFFPISLQLRDVPLEALRSGSYLLFCYYFGPAFPPSVYRYLLSNL